jgi:hypothetical protein
MRIDEEGAVSGTRDTWTVRHELPRDVPIGPSLVAEAFSGPDVADLLLDMRRDHSWRQLSFVVTPAAEPDSIAGRVAYTRGWDHADPRIPCPAARSTRASLFLEGSCGGWTAVPPEVTAPAPSSIPTSSGGTTQSACAERSRAGAATVLACPPRSLRGSQRSSMPFH